VAISQTHEPDPLRSILALLLPGMVLQVDHRVLNNAFSDPEPLEKAERFAKENGLLFRYSRNGRDVVATFERVYPKRSTEDA